MLGSGSIRSTAVLMTGAWAIAVRDQRHPAIDLNSLADDVLVRKARAGDQKSFEALVRRYQKLVYNVIYQMIRSHESAADLTQDTFLKAYRALSSFDLDRSFKPWLLRIATNSTLNHIRFTKGAHSLEELLEQNPQAEPAARDDVEAEVEFRVSQHQLFDALGQLPMRQRQIFILRYQQDLPYDEIAEVTNTS